MFKVAILAAVAGASASMQTKKQFLSFMTKFGKEYEVEETAQRFNTFVENLKVIEEHNAKGESWTMAVTEFADLTHEEFSALYKGLNNRDRSHMRSRNEYVPVGTPKDEVNWVTAGAVTPVKDQGQCGSCWAFSTTGGLEGASQLSTGKLTSLSEQQLVDCAGSAGNQGCNGGLMDDGFEYIIKNGGLGLESDYSYTGKDGSCKKVSSAVSMTGYTDVKAKDEAGLLSAVSERPVSIAVDAGLGWQLYGGGVLKNCKGKQLDHGVLAAGYGTDGGDDYWLVKNSWGKSWGEDGYIRLLRDMDACGLADAASFPTI